LPEAVKNRYFARDFEPVFEPPRVPPRLPAAAGRFAPPPDAVGRFVPLLFFVVPAIVLDSPI